MLADEPTRSGGGLMLLLLLRHGEDDRAAGDDPPLTERGVAQVRSTAEALLELCPDGVEEVWISPARRTREAASLIKEVLLTGWDRVDARLGPGQGAARHIEIIERAQLNGLQSLLIVGHNPDLGEVALRCVGEREEFERGLLAHGECLHVRLSADDASASGPLLVVGGSSVRTLDLGPGDVVDARQVAERANAVFALSEFDRVAYQLTGDPNQPTLDLHVEESSLGRHVLRFDLGLHIGTDENTAFTLGGDYLQTWVNDRGGEVHGSFRVGRTSGLAASFYQPLDASHQWFVEPAVVGQRSLEDLFLDGDALTRFRFSSGWAAADIGRVFGRRAELRAGVRSGVQFADQEIGSRELGDVPTEGYGGFAARYTVDTRDRDVLWERGSFTRITYFHSDKALGGESPYDRLEGVTTFVLPFRRNVGYLRLSGGSSLDSDLPLYDTFTLGGPVSLPGLSIGELRGNSYWSAQASYLQRIADISYIFGQSIYAGLRLTAADMSGRIDSIRAEPTYSGAFVLAGRTPLGPVSLSLAATADSDWQLVLSLGRPIEERAITDPTW